MSEFRLEARTGFGLTSRLEESWNGFSLTEIEGRQSWWIAVTPEATKRLSAACEKAFGKALPQAGKFATGRHEGEEIRLLAAGDGQFLFAGASSALPDWVAQDAAVTEQSDGLVALSFSGARTRDVMERLCGLDLHPSSFPAGSCARAPIEGMAAIIACEDDKEPRLLVIVHRSSARSFADHVRHAAASACGGH